MDKTGVLGGKENVEPQETVVRMSEHAAKVREAREARRKRILARSSERFAFITGEANAIPTSPLLDHHKSNAQISLPSLLNQDISHHSSEDSAVKKSLFNEHEQTEAHKKPVDNRENTNQEGVIVAQTLRNEKAMEASKEQAHKESMKENLVTLKGIFNNCIKQSVFPRLMSATCIALAFLASGYMQGVSSRTTLGFMQSGHLGSSNMLSTICYALASVMLVDLLVFIWSLFFCREREQFKMMRTKEACADKATFSILLHLLLSISLDCSISASLLSGGLLLLSKVA